MMSSLLRKSLAVGGLLAATSALALPIVHTTDFIADGTRTAFNGFEAAPVILLYGGFPFYAGGNGPYVEDGISVEQVNGDGPGSISMSASFPGSSGRVWYPDGGDAGYTRITLSGGGAFQDVGFNYGSGGGASLILYELYSGGSLVLSGTSALGGVSYLGFSGGGFDTILVRDNLTNTGGPVANGAYQALRIDSIETQGTAAVPDQPATLALTAMAAAGLLALRRRSAAGGR